MSHILVVDDDLSILGVMKRVLEKSEFSVDTVTNGQDALTRITAKRPDLVILDVEIPGLSGLEILDKIRSLRPKLPVVMMSSRHDRHIILQACESGANTFFPKPFDSEMFCRKIEDLLHKVDFFK